MTQEFIPYEQTLALKELGFDEPCIAFYNGKFLDYKIHSGDIRPPYLSTENRGECPNAPLYQQVFRWFREKHGYFTSPTQSTKTSGSEYDWLITKEMDESRLFIRFVGYHPSYEEAELECIKELINIVKNKING